MDHGGWSGRAGGREPRSAGYRPPARLPGGQVRGVSGAGRRVPVGRPPAARIIGLVAVVGLALVLVVAGFIFYKLEDLSQGMASSSALEGAATSTDGGTTILLMGLDSRKDQNGQQLPAQILDQLHAGDGDEGGYNTNTLILMHVPGDGGPVRALSIPRDDAVAIPGEGKNKIKQAYGLAKARAETQLSRQGVTDAHTLETQSRDAGRRATLEVVRALTAVPIDHFAEVSLAGFYDLATALGGVEVCLNHPVADDAYSGANFPAGRQTLNGAQALAFVRQRHGLTNGDLDRTHRQQAFLASASQNIRSLGTLLNPAKMQNLIDTAKKDVVIDDGWGVLSLGMQLRKLTGGNTQFQTLPIKGYGTIDGQSVNLIDPDQIRSVVHTTFTDHTSSSQTPASTVDVVNASGKDGAAGNVAGALTQQGFTTGTVSTGTSRRTSTVAYSTDASADAQKVAQALGGLTTTADSTIASGHVQVILGRDFTAPTSSSASAPATNPPPPGPQDAPGHTAPGDIPCVD